MRAANNVTSKAMRRVLSAGVILWASLGASAALAADPVSGLAPGWNRIEGAPGTACSEGSAYAFFVRPGDPGKLMVYFEGGGACWSGENCDLGRGHFYIPAVGKRKEPFYGKGIFDFDNSGNPVKDFTAVFVPYCTGDVFLGDRTVTYKAASPADSARTFQIRHVGRTDAESALAWIFGHVPDPKVIFACGSSAGAIASPVFAAELATHFPQSRVVQLGDAAGGYQGPDEPKVFETWGATTALRERSAAFRSLDPSSLKLETLYVVSAREAPRVRYAQYNNVADSTQTNLLTAFGGEKAPLASVLARNLGEIRAANPAFRSYTAPGDCHAILMRSLFYELTVDGVRFRDWLAAWLGNEPVNDVGDDLLPGTRGEIPAANSAPQHAVLLRNVRVFEDSRGVMSDPQDILIADGRIAAVGRDLKAGPDAQRIDCAGKYAVPGLFDFHVHITPLTLEGGDTLRTTLAQFVARGITHVRDVGGPIDILQRMKEEIASGEMPGPEIFYAGPMLEHSPLHWAPLNEKLPGFTVAVDSIAAVDSLLPALARQGACMIKTFNKQDPAVYRHLLDTAKGLSLRVTHDPGGPLFHTVPMDVALDLGITCIEHAKAPWPVVLKDDLRQAHDALVGPGHDEGARMAVLMKAAALGVGSISEDRLRQLAEKMKQRNAYLCPTLNVFTNAEKAAIEDTKKQMGVDSLPAPVLQRIRTMTGGMAAVSRHFVRQFASYGVKMMVGQDGDDPAGTFTEMRTMKEEGVSEAEIIKGATLYPARWLGVDDRLGTIAPKREADLLVTNGDPLADIAQMESTFLVIHKGRVIQNHEGR